MISRIAILDYVESKIWITSTQISFQTDAS